ncbi:MAG: hypothetical protein RL340_381 [Gemmatimonadota bacterium]
MTTWTVITRTSVSRKGRAIPQDTRMLPVVLLALGALLSLPLTALGLPGTWLFLAGATLYKAFAPAAGLTWVALGVAASLAAVAELLEFVVSVRATTQTGGSSRAAWGALLGGLAGAIVGVPIPLLGSLVGSFLGAFAGALAAEYSVHGDEVRAGRVAWGALVGRVVAAAVKVAFGVLVAVIVCWSAAA